jgi:hypothetical protein
VPQGKKLSRFTSPEGLLYQKAGIALQADMRIATMMGRSASSDGAIIERCAKI